MSLDPYWTEYARTLADVREEKPENVQALKVILDRFTPPSSALAFFPDGADDTLMSALQDSGWEVVWAAAYYHYVARHTASGAQLTYVEGDVYEGWVR